MPHDFSYRSPTLSLWQAAVAQVQRNRSSVQARMSPPSSERLAAKGPLVAETLMAPAHLVGSHLASGQTASPEPLSSPPSSPVAPSSAPAIAVEPVDCAKTAAQFLWAEIKGDKDTANACASTLKYSNCNAVGWAECVTSYLAYKATCGTLPYRPNQDIVKPLPENAKIAILGDWGTGDAIAIHLLEQVAEFQPDLLIHLGDIYFAGTQSEANDNFLAVCRQVLGSSVPLYSLCGNHDMYSGGDGYYWLIDQIGQQSSYLCLQNDDWQFLLLDTGHNDHNPGTVNSNMTSLVDIPGWSEANWHLNKIAGAGKRRTALFSHHQLFSPFGSVGTVNNQRYAYNTSLFSSFGAVLPKIDLWFWGHEHTLALYDSYMGLARGRCVGASAVPVYSDQQQYAAGTNLQTLPGMALPTWSPAAVLGCTRDVYNNAFAILTLAGSGASVDYYQVPLLQAASKLPLTDTL